MGMTRTGLRRRRKEGDKVATLEPGEETRHLGSLDAVSPVRSLSSGREGQLRSSRKTHLVRRSRVQTEVAQHPPHLTALEEARERGAGQMFEHQHPLCSTSIMFSYLSVNSRENLM